MPATEALVFDAIRTPRGKGKANGSLHATKPVDLVVGLMHETLSRNPELDPDRIDDVVLGCVSPIGDQGADIAKTAAIKAGLPDTVAGVQLNRFCASGLEAVNIAAQKVASGWEDLVWAGRRRVDVEGADGLRRGGVDDGPRDQPGDALRAPGRRRRPDRDDRGLLTRGRRRVRGALAGAGRDRAGRRALQQVGDPGARSVTARRSSITTSSSARAPPWRRWPG